MLEPVAARAENRSVYNLYVDDPQRKFIFSDRQPSDAGRSASPASEVGNGSDDRLNGRGKEKAKPKILGEFFSGFNKF